MKMTQVNGGVCAPRGFRAAGVHCGIAKKAEKKDLALIVSDIPCRAAGVYTKNLVKAAPIKITEQHLRDHTAQAILCNSGNANACHATSHAVAEKMCALAAKALKIPAASVIPASTGVIGQPLNPDLIENGIPQLLENLSTQGSRSAVHAIMTTDTMEKEIAVTFEIDGATCTLGGIAKGSGMIHPNMATMLAFLTTDANIAAPALQKALAHATEDTFNMVSVDGDTSTNDMAVILANGKAQNPEITEDTVAYTAFSAALLHVCTYLARRMAKDGEGATKLLECTVTGAPSDHSARLLCKSVIASSLFKSAMFGADANWGRVLCAMGYAGTAFDADKVSVAFSSSAGQIRVCENGSGLPFDEAQAKKILKQDEIEIHIALAEGDGRAVAWGCDLTYDYVKINGDYRS
jgi:glutamate N-acetyltransferase/amino-acid acetyltransferase